MVGSFRRHSAFARRTSVRLQSIMFTNSNSNFANFTNERTCTTCSCQMKELNGGTVEEDPHPAIEEEEQHVPEKKRTSWDLPRFNHVLIAFIVLVVVATTITLAVVLSPDRNQHVSRVNVLVIIADDLGYNDVGYRGSDIKTPYIDRLARSSIVLDRHYAQPMCSPSRAALFTGRYPFRYGMGGSRAIYYRSRHGLNTSEKLLPEIFKAEDYNTYLIGKWHLGFAKWAMTPTRRGFDYFYGAYGGSATYKTHKSYEGPISGDGYDLFEDRRDVDSATGQVNHTVVKDPDQTFSELLFTEKAVNNIREERLDDKPFFMVVSYQNPHAPVDPLQRDINQNSFIKNEERRKMAGLITSLDYGVGRLTAALESTHQFNNTIIVFLSDNGGHIAMPNGRSLGSSNLPFRGTKTTLYEGGVRTPAFIRIPEFLSQKVKNRTNPIKFNGLFHITDWFPTLLNLAKIDYGPAKSNLDGIDHSETFKRSLLEGSSLGKAPRDNLILDIDPVFNQAGVLRSDNFKLFVGNPAFLNFSQVYPLINEHNIELYPDIVANTTHYKTKIDLAGYSAAQVQYNNNPNKCLTLACMSPDLTLFDLSVDPTEDRDVSQRFPDVTDELYTILSSYANSTLPLPVPIYFEDQNEAALKDGVWTPWLDEEEEEGRDSSTQNYKSNNTSG